MFGHRGKPFGRPELRGPTGSGIDQCEARPIRSSGRSPARPSGRLPPARASRSDTPAGLMPKRREQLQVLIDHVRGRRTDQQIIQPGADLAAVGRSKPDPSPGTGQAGRHGTFAQPLHVDRHVEPAPRPPPDFEHRARTFQPAAAERRSIRRGPDGRRASRPLALRPSKPDGPSAARCAGAEHRQSVQHVADGSQANDQNAGDRGRDAADHMQAVARAQGQFAPLRLRGSAVGPTAVRPTPRPAGRSGPAPCRPGRAAPCRRRRRAADRAGPSSSRP